MVVSMIIMIMFGTQPLPARGADNHHRPLRRPPAVSRRGHVPHRAVCCCALPTRLSSAAAFFRTGRRFFFVATIARAIWLTCDC
jgi:hypothetical protein